MTTKFLCVALLVLAGCESAVDGPPADESWVVGRYATGNCFMTDALTDGYMDGCVARSFYEVEFLADGRTRSTEYDCFESHPTQPDQRGRWRATEEEGVVVVLPPEDESSFRLTLSVIEHAEVRRTDGCLRVDVHPRDPDGKDQSPYQIHRGEFAYTPSIEGCEPEARYAVPPDCADDAP